VFVALGIQHAMHPVICDMSDFTTFLYIISSIVWFLKKFTSNKRCGLIIFNTKSETFYEDLSEIWLKMCIDLHIKYPLFLSDCNESWIFSADFPIKFMKRLQVGGELFQENRHDAGDSSISKVYKCNLLNEFWWNLLLTLFVDILHWLVFKGNTTFQ